MSIKNLIVFSKRLPPEYVGGIETSAYYMIRNLSRQNEFRVRVITVRSKILLLLRTYKREFDGESVLTSHLKKSEMKKLPVIEKMLRGTGFDPAETLIYHNTLDLYPFYEHFRAQGYAQVARSGGNDIFFMEKTARERLVAGINQLDYLIVNSNFSLGRSAELGIDKQRMTVIKGGCEPAPEQTPEIDLADDRPVLLTCGRLVDFKGLEDALHALALVKQEGLSFRFVIVGEGELRPELESLSSRLGLEDDVCFYGKVAPAMVQSFYKRSALYLSTSKDIQKESKGVSYLHTETMGRSICEAQANAVPVVATDAGGVPEMLQPNKTGLLVPQGNVQAIADAVCQLLGDTELRHQMGIAARQFAQTDFGWGRVVGQSIDVIRRIKGDDE
ncbi:glycosyltransferase family 4 protein [Marinobacterium mangrovicola]|uniref:Glycosyltransferase involved in cell wall biosynthesis n=1 Tax=Marinobacterium mangrovicola TaxID=1476959 RepID=A0A4R1G8Q1_9GAMM|nr:glycosyltransferase family 4 protein [Marinobacterium mangrovicola]TCK03061.1 glycosyltransferase involved in cell wall biosynthesis [Marinobacterium mangrovicola]